MKRIFLTSFAAVLLIAFISIGFAQIYEISSKKQLTTDPHYDRNPSFFKKGTTWWLFFVRSQDGDSNYGAGCLGKGCDVPGCNCDNSEYDVYYIKSTDNGNTWSSELKVTPCSTGQRGMAAFVDNTGKIWVFVSSPGTGTIQYCNSNDGITWTGPTGIGVTGYHVDAFQAKDGKIYVFYESSGIKYGYYDGTTWTHGTVDSTAGMGIPKCMQDSSGRFYCVYANWGSGGKYYYSVSDDGVTWINKGELVNVPGTISNDPVMYQDSNGIYWLFYAPWDQTENSQWIEYKFSTNGKTWFGPFGLTIGGYNGKSWWDFWPEVAEGSDIIIFYTSEQNTEGNDRIDGNIWMIRLKNKLSELQQDVNVLRTQTSDHESRIDVLESFKNGLDEWKTSIENEIRGIWAKLEILQNFVQSVLSCAMATFSPFYECMSGSAPEPWEQHCGNGICDWNKGETPASCPQDCEQEIIQDGTIELKVAESWKVKCPESFTVDSTTYTTNHCRAELWKYTWKISERKLNVGEEWQVNKNAGYFIKLYANATKT